MPNHEDVLLKTDVETPAGMMTLINGQLYISMPDDPRVHEEPTHFNQALTHAETASLLEALPTKMRVRLSALIERHANDLGEKARHYGQIKAAIGNRHEDAKRLSELRKP